MDQAVKILVDTVAKRKQHGRQLVKEAVAVADGFNAVPKGKKVRKEKVLSDK